MAGFLGVNNLIMSYISAIEGSEESFLVKRGNTLSAIYLQFFSKIENIETPINLTGYTFILNVVKRNTNTTVLMFTIGSGLTIQNLNELVISKSAFDMNIPVGVYYYTLESSSPLGIVITELYGDFIVE